MRHMRRWRRLKRVTVRSSTAPGQAVELPPAPRTGPSPVAAAELRPSDLGLGTLFNQLLDAVVVAHLTSGRIVLWNAAAEKLFGFTSAEAIGQTIDILIPPSISPLHHEGVDRYVRTGHGLIADADGPVELPAQRRSGESIRIELALTEVRGPDGERYGVAMMRDAMPRKRLELTQLELVQARMARSEAEAELAADDRLFDALLAALGPDPIDADVRNVVRALADFRRLRHGNLDIQPIDADLAALVADMAEKLSRRNSRRLCVRGPDTMPARFDPRRTIDVLNQVFEEGMRRSGCGSVLEVRLEQPTPRTAQVFVRAPGTGVSSALGVGLQIAQMVMDRQGGTLTTALTASGGLEVALGFPCCPRVPGRERERRSARHPGAARAL